MQRGKNERLAKSVFDLGRLAVVIAQQIVLSLSNKMLPREVDQTSVV